MIFDKPWIAEITIDDLSNEDLKIVAELIGLDVAIKMMCELPGITISIPQKATLTAKIKYIRKNYDGSKNPAMNSPKPAMSPKAISTKSSETTT